MDMNLTAKQYPGVRNVKVTLRRNKFDCDFLIDYDPVRMISNFEFHSFSSCTRESALRYYGSLRSQPIVPPGRKFDGVLIEIFDYRGKRMIESTKSQADRPIIKGMPFFSKFDVRVHALYLEGDDHVETDSESIEFKTGVGGESPTRDRLSNKDCLMKLSV